MIQEGISFTKVIGSAIHKLGSTKTEKKKVINDLIENKLKIEERIGGASLEDKIVNLVEYINRKDKEDSISISVHGYDKLLGDLHESVPNFAAKIKKEFEFQDSVPLKAPTLLLYNLKPLDILYVLSEEEIKGTREYKVLDGKIYQSSILSKRIGNLEFFLENVGKSRNVIRKLFIRTP